MPWVKLDDRFPSHRKVALLSDRAFRLHVSAICWCAENLTDGRIGDRELPLVAHIRGIKAIAKQLEDAGVWDRIEDGWAIHDYLDYNPSREQVLLDRKKNAERQERWRQRKNGKPTPPDGSSNGRSNGVTSSGASTKGESKRGKTRHESDTNSTRSEAVPEEESQVSAIRNGVTNDAPTRPVPEPLSMAEVGGSSNGSSELANERPDGLAPIDVDGFALNDGMRRWAHRDGYAALVDLDYETAQFVSHFRANGQRRSNWNDEWQKWIRRAHKWAVERGQRSLPAAGADNVVPMRPSTADQRVAAGQALAAKFRAEEQRAIEAAQPDQEPA